MRYILALLLLSSTASVAAAQNLPDFGEGVTVVKNPSLRNATCFLYPNNNYKCACAQPTRQNQQQIWTNVPIEEMNGQLSTDVIYVHAERCKNQ